MRIGLPKVVLALVAVTVWMATDLAPVGWAAPPSRAMASLAQINSQAAAAPSPLALDRGELRLQIDVTSKELRAADERRRQLDETLTIASAATAELRTETNAVGQETLSYAIDNFRHSQTPTGFTATSDLTESMRASALSGVAVSSDTESFDAYRDLRKDLELEEEELVRRELEVADAAAEVDELEVQLETELLVYGEMEERRLQNQAAVTSIQASNRAQYRGRKQGYYLDVCPMNGPHSFIDSWGFARSGGRRHQGVDILADPGVEIVAPVSGTVEHYTNSLGGRSFRLFGETGTYFYGTHMSAFGKEGEVKAGEVIGYNGDDGNAAGIPHLHFEIHPGGQGSPAVSPFVDTAAVCSGAQY